MTLASASVSAAEISDHLTDKQGRAVYVLDGASCDENCALLWPVVPAGQFEGASVAHAALVGVEVLPEGTPVATYAGKRLHYFAEDVLPGEANGHRFQEFGNVSYLVADSGREIGGRTMVSYEDDEACGCTEAPASVTARFETAFAN